MMTRTWASLTQSEKDQVMRKIRSLLRLLDRQHSLEGEDALLYDLQVMARMYPVAYQIASGGRR